MTVRQMIPAPVKHRLRSLHRAFTYRRAVRAFRRGRTDEATLGALRYGWSSRFAAGEPYLAECIARATGGRVLECGSGLSTIVLGILAEQRGLEVWSLEHHPQWMDLVRKEVRRLRLNNVHLRYAPLVDHGDCDWYRIPDDLPATFDLVVCDGPPDTTHGGRLGVLTITERLRNCVVLMDDAHRDNVRALAARLGTDLGAQVERHDGYGSYFIATINEPVVSH